MDDLLLKQMQQNESLNCTLLHDLYYDACVPKHEPNNTFLNFKILTSTESVQAQFKQLDLWTAVHNNYGNDPEIWGCFIASLFMILLAECFCYFAPRVFLSLTRMELFRKNSTLERADCFRDFQLFILAHFLFTVGIVYSSLELETLIVSREESNVRLCEDLLQNITCSGDPFLIQIHLEGEKGLCEMFLKSKMALPAGRFLLGLARACSIHFFIFLCGLHCFFYFRCRFAAGRGNKKTIVRSTVFSYYIFLDWIKRNTTDQQRFIILVGIPMFFFITVFYGFAMIWGPGTCFLGVHKQIVHKCKEMATGLSADFMANICKNRYESVLHPRSEFFKLIRKGILLFLGSLYWHTMCTRKYPVEDVNQYICDRCTYLKSKIQEKEVQEKEEQK